MALLVVVFTFPGKVLAEDPRYYSGIQFSSAHDPRGIGALIRTPDEPPVVFPIQQAHWVSVMDAPWLQTGWIYYEWDNGINRKYYEYLTANNDYFIETNEYGSQGWGTATHYQVAYDEATGEWGAYIDGWQVAKLNIGGSLPRMMGAKSEVVGSGRSELWAGFSELIYKRPDVNVWNYISNEDFGADFPYTYYKYNDTAFDTYRLLTTDVLMPLVLQ